MATKRFDELSPATQLILTTLLTYPQNWAFTNAIQASETELRQMAQITGDDIEDALTFLRAKLASGVLDAKDELEDTTL